MGGSKVLDTEHILLGVVYVGTEIVQKIASSISLEWIRSRAAFWHTPKEKVPMFVDIPLSEEAERALVRAESLADTHGSTFIRTEHLLLALMTETSSHAAILLEEAGGSLRSLETCVAELTGNEQQAGVPMSLDDLGE